MNKHEYKLKTDELEFALAEKLKEFNHLQGEHRRLKTAYDMSNNQIKELRREERRLKEQLEKERGNFKLALARVKQLELERDASLLIYSKWLRDHEFVVTVNKPDELVKTFNRAVKKVLTQNQSKDE